MGKGLGQGLGKGFGKGSGLGKGLGSGKGEGWAWDRARARDARSAFSCAKVGFASAWVVLVFGLGLGLDLGRG